MPSKNHHNGIANLSQLGNLPDEQLSEIIPKILPDCKILIEHGFVLATPAGADEATELFSVDSPALTVFNQFNGQTFLADVVGTIARNMDWDIDYAFAYVRGVFLSLVVAGVCIPAFFTK